MNKFIELWFTVPAAFIMLILVSIIAIIYISAAFIKDRKEQRDNRGYMPRYKAPKLKQSKLRKIKR